MKWLFYLLVCCQKLSDFSLWILSLITHLFLGIALKSLHWDGHSTPCQINTRAIKKWRHIEGEAWTFDPRVRKSSGSVFAVEGISLAFLGPLGQNQYKVALSDLYPLFKHFGLISPYCRTEMHWAEIYVNKLWPLQSPGIKTNQIIISGWRAWTCYWNALCHHHQITKWGKILRKNTVTSLHNNDTDLYS